MSGTGRPTPVDLVFGPTAAERFPALQRGLAAAGRDPRDRDGFVLVEEVGELLRELRPEGGLGETVAALVSLVQASYLHWLDGGHTRSVSEPALNLALAAEGTCGTAASSPEATYVQLPPLKVWGVPSVGSADEPLDGWFVWRRDERLMLLAVFGLFPGRDGLTLVEAEGPRPGPLAREDGTPLFAPTLPGGSAAGLASVAGQEELLELAWRLEESR